MRAFAVAGTLLLLWISFASTAVAEDRVRVHPPKIHCQYDNPVIDIPCVRACMLPSFFGENIVGKVADYAICMYQMVRDLIPISAPVEPLP